MGRRSRDAPRVKALLRAVREQARITQQQLADAIGENREQIVRWERPSGGEPTEWKTRWFILKALTAAREGADWQQLRTLWGFSEEVVDASETEFDAITRRDQIPDFILGAIEHFAEVLDLAPKAIAMCFFGFLGEFGFHTAHDLVAALEVPSATRTNRIRTLGPWIARQVPDDVKEVVRQAVASRLVAEFRSMVEEDEKKRRGWAERCDSPVPFPKELLAEQARRVRLLERSVVRLADVLRVERSRLKKMSKNTRAARPARRARKK